MKLKVELTSLPSGRLVAYVPGLPGCAAEGNSEVEVIAGIREAIELYLRCLNEDPGARTLNTHLIEVTV
ncbi:MAG: type II toxin-antitoxin system HicB family antitoxin [Methanoregulaceae archaeon]